jgi:1-acyl-sn-glycerol-3-phosphate acyltransferase
MIRAIRYLTATAVWTVYYASRVIVAALVGIKQEPGGLYDRIERGYGTAMLRSTRMTLHVEGLDRLRPGQSVVYVSNHLSWVDIWALLAGLPGSLRFVFKKELSRVPFLGQALNAMGHIKIDRGNRGSAFASYDRAADQIHGGISPIVFAEGTRSRDGKLKPFKKGPFVLAIAAKVPVVPVVCVETFERLPKGSVAAKPGPVTVRIGIPIPTEGLDYDARDELAERTRAAMLAMGAVE